MATGQPQKTLLTSESPVATTDSRPVPDPTYLTTQQLNAAISALREVLNVRLDGMDKAVELMQEKAARSPTIAEAYARFDERFSSIGGQFQSIADIQKERFIRIDQQFMERDKRTDQLTLASSTAIAAALQAQKEAAGETQKSSSLAITKSETATVESIKQLQTLFQTSIAGLSSQIQDVKSRLDKGEGKTSVSEPANHESLASLKQLLASVVTSRDQSAGGSAQTSFIIVLVVAVVAVVGLGITIATKISGPQQTTIGSR